MARGPRLAHFKLVLAVHSVGNDTQVYLTEPAMNRAIQSCNPVVWCVQKVSAH
jgi:hypothetical protein